MSDKITEKIRGFDENNDGKIDAKELKDNVNSLTREDLLEVGAEMKKKESKLFGMLEGGLKDTFKQFKEKKARGEQLSEIEVSIMYMITYGGLEAKFNVELLRQPKAPDKLSINESIDVYKDFIEVAKDINGVERNVLNKELFEAYVRSQNGNSEALNNVLSDPQKSDKFKDFTNSGYGEYIIANSLYHYNKQQLSKDVGLDTAKLQNSPQEAKVFDEFHTNFVDTVKHLSKTTNEFNQKIFQTHKSIRENLTSATANAYYINGSYNEMFDNINNEYASKLEETIKTDFKKIALDYGKMVVLMDSQKGNNNFGGIKTLTLGNFNLCVNFDVLNGKLTEATKSKGGELTPEEKIKILESNIDEIIRDTRWEQIKDGVQNLIQYTKNNPLKIQVDALATILGGVAAGALTASTGGWGILESTVAFTAVNDTIKILGYGAIGAYEGKGFMAGAQEGYGIDPEKHNDMTKVFTKKTFDFASNAALFGIFRGTYNGLDKIGIHDTKVINRIMIESGFFTAYQSLAVPAESTLMQHMDKGFNKSEATDVFMSNFESVTSTGNLAQLYLYNMGFISLVRVGAYGSEKGIHNLNLSNTSKLNQTREQLIFNGDRIQRHITHLQQLGYKFHQVENNAKVDLVVTNPQGEKINPKIDSNFTRLFDVFEQNTVLAKDLGKYIDRGIVLDQLQNGPSITNSKKNENEKEPKKENDNEAIPMDVSKGGKHKPENGRGGGSGNNTPIEIPIGGKIKLQDVMRGFGVEKQLSDGITSRFSKLLDNFANLKEIGKIDTEVSKVVDQEFTELVKHLEGLRGLTADQIFLIETFKAGLPGTKNRIKQEFGEALSKRIGKQELGDKYGDKEFVTKIMDKYEGQMDYKIKHIYFSDKLPGINPLGEFKN